MADFIHPFAFHIALALPPGLFEIPRLTFSALRLSCRCGSLSYLCPTITFIVGAVVLLTYIQLSINNSWAIYGITEPVISLTSSLMGLHDKHPLT